MPSIFVFLLSLFLRGSVALVSSNDAFCALPRRRLCVRSDSGLPYGSHANKFMASDRRTLAENRAQSVHTQFFFHSSVRHMSIIFPFLCMEKISEQRGELMRVVPGHNWSRALQQEEQLIDPLCPGSRFHIQPRHHSSNSQKGNTS